MKSNQEIIQSVKHDYPHYRDLFDGLDYGSEQLLDILMNRARADQSDSERKLRSVNQPAF